MSLTQLLHSDRAENSIMQTISIAVSAILIAAGLVTAPGLINNARDNNAKTDLANIAYAEEFVLSVGNHYIKYVNPADELAQTGKKTGNDLLTVASKLSADNGGATSISADGDSNGGVKFNLGGDVSGHALQTCDVVNYFISKDKSSSGTWFYGSSDSSVITPDFASVLARIPAKVTAACPDLGTGFEAPPAPGGGDGTGPIIGNPGGVDPSMEGVTIINTDVHSIISSDEMEITGYKPFTSSDADKFGGGNSWAPDENSSITWSYLDTSDASKSKLVAFSTVANYNSNSEYIRAQYDKASGELYGIADEYGSNVENNAADFNKIATVGGGVTFTDAKTNVKITLVWTPVANDNKVANTPVFGGHGGVPDPTAAPTNGDGSTQIGHTASYNNWVQTVNVQDQMIPGTQVLYTSPDGKIIELSSTNGTLIGQFLSTDYGKTFVYEGTSLSCATGGTIITNDGKVISGSGNIPKNTNVSSVMKFCDTVTDSKVNVQGLGMTSDFTQYSASGGPYPEGFDSLVGAQGSNHRTGFVISDDGKTIIALATHSNAADDGTADYTKSWFQVSTDGGATGTRVGSHPAEWATDIQNSYTNKVGMWLSGDGSKLVFQNSDHSIFISDDHGATGTTVDLPDNAQLNDYNDLDVQISTNGNNIIVGAGNGYVGISTNGGDSFTWKHMDNANNDISQVLISDNGQRMVAFDKNENGLYISSDGGDTWMNDGQGNYADGQLTGNADLSEINFLWRGTGGTNNPFMLHWTWGDTTSFFVCDSNCGNGGGGGVTVS
jgi:hypothetical protein